MKVSTLLFVCSALTLAEAIQHRRSQINKVTKEQLLAELYSLRIQHVGPLMFTSFIRPIFPQYNSIEGVYNESVSEEYWKCVFNMNDAPQSRTGCVEPISELHKCYAPIAEIWRRRLPENAQWIPELLGKSTTTLQEFVCNSEHALPLVSEMRKVRQCETTVGTIDNNELNRQAQSLHKRYTKKLDVFKARPTKANLCEATESVYSRNVDLAEMMCNDHKPLKALTNYFKESIRYLCA